ncbi:MAG: Ribonuclease HII, partial [Candidatus Giovannonibacteria bacterium GW2011_GWA2_53_7]
FFRQMRRLKDEGLLRYSVAFSTHSLIDEEGITAAVKIAIAEALRKLKAEPHNCSIFLDGLLAAPAEYKRQHTIIGGDDILPLISLAAIAAKVTRDRLMIRLSKKYPQYGFESHKGYGTQQHWDALNQFGLCEIHRRTYCKIIQKS